MFIKKDLRKIDEILFDEMDERTTLKLSKRYKRQFPNAHPNMQSSIAQPNLVEMYQLSAQKSLLVV